MANSFNFNNDKARHVIRMAKDSTAAKIREIFGRKRIPKYNPGSDEVDAATREFLVNGGEIRRF